LQEFDYPAASAIASVVLGLSLVLFIAANQMLKRFARRIGSPS
ncbi:MAG TPA: molybdate ABC transporter permease subunit, partial [Sutterella wadsworthensis]|nr:molybdate ABC transporter permease subunit [Sutterella wadsworthensis]